MMTRAQTVLDDCRVALQLLEEEKDLQRWRVHWVAALALVRAVGHVLDKVDGADPAIGAAAREAYKRWKSRAPGARNLPRIHRKREKYNSQGV